jgi:hypothetical protein
MPDLIFSCFRLNQQIVIEAKQKFMLNAPNRCSTSRLKTWPPTQILIGNLTNSYWPKGVMKAPETERDLEVSTVHVQDAATLRTGEMLKSTLDRRQREEVMN